MRRLLSSAALLPVALVAIAATPIVAVDDTPACDTAGREILDVSGFELTFDSPAVTAPELAATNDVTGDLATPHRSATFFFTPLFPGADDGVETDVSLSWGNATNDYDIFLFDAEGFELGRSDSAQVQDGAPAEEALSITLEHCEPFQVAVRAWAGAGEQLTLSITPDADSPAAPVAEERTVLYLAGDRPGNASTLYGPQPPAEGPFRTAFTADRPTNGDPNLLTRPVAGSTIEANYFQPFWRTELEDEPDIVGDASALVWVSSPSGTATGTGTFYVQLWIDGGMAGEVEITGDQLGPEPRPIIAHFPDIEASAAWNVTLQVVTHPVVSPNTQSEDPGDANHTVWYDSIQYQSRLILPIAPVA